MSAADFRIIRPVKIYNGNLISSNVPETDYAAYSSTATYVPSDRVMVASPSSTVTISNSNNCIVTWTNHALENGDPVVITTTGALPAGLTVGTIYYVRILTLDKFNLAAELDGPLISTTSAGSGTHTMTASVHRVYEAIVGTGAATCSASGTVMTAVHFLDGFGQLFPGMILTGSGVTAGTRIVSQINSGEANDALGGKGDYRISISQTFSSTLVTGNSPVTDKANWKLAWSTKRWSMFDGAYYSATDNPDTITVVIQPNEMVTAVALMNVQGLTATVTSSDGWTQTNTLRRHDVLNWYDWYFEPLVQVEDTVFFDVSPSVTSTLTITIDNTGGVAKCGVCVVGRARTLGATQWELSRSINDYSRVSEDIDGNITVTRGRFAKRMSLNFRVTPGEESEVTRTLEDHRGIPLALVGSEEYANTMLWCLLESWDIPITLIGAPASLTAKGLT